MIYLLLVIALFAVVILAVRISTLSSKVENLEWNMAKLLKLPKIISDLEVELANLRTGAPIPKEPAAKPSSAREEKAVAKVEPLQPAQPPPLYPQAKPSRTKEEWEALVGGKVLNRVGALALILGIGFFLKYAFDNNWISESTRVILGALAGGACLALGYRTHTKGFQIFSQGLVGAGIAILYLSVYAAFNFYQLVPQIVAFLLMAVVTVIALANALYYDSLAIALLGWAGGFLTPIMLSTGEANETGLFTYLALLDLGILAVAARKDSWFVLEPLTLLATWLMYLTWFDQFYTHDDLAITLFFITVFWALFYGLEFLHADKPATGTALVRQVVPGLNALFFYPSLYTILDKAHHNWMGGVTLVLGAVYFATVVGLTRRKSLTDFVRVRYSLTAVSLLVLATAIQFSGFRTISLWALEAAFLLWCSVRWNLRFVLYACFALFGLALLKLFGTEGAFFFPRSEEFTFVFNERFAPFLILAACAGASSFMVRRHEHEDERRFAPMFDYTWCVLLFVLLSVETNDYFLQRIQGQRGDLLADLTYTEALSMSMLWAVYSLPLAWAGGRWRLRALLVSGIAAFALAASLAVVRGIAFQPLAYFTPVLNLRLAALLFVAAAFSVHIWGMMDQHDSFPWTRELTPVFQVGLVLVLFVLITGEARDFFQQKIVPITRDAERADELSTLQNLQQLSLSAAWLLYSAVLMALGIWRALRGMRIISIVVFAFTILKIFTFDLSFLETLYRIYSFIGLGLILLAVSYAYQKYKTVILGTGGTRQP